MSINAGGLLNDPNDKCGECGTTESPTELPSKLPRASPAPSDQPSMVPSLPPTLTPSKEPSENPSKAPSNMPSNTPTGKQDISELFIENSVRRNLPPVTGMETQNGNIRIDYSATFVQAGLVSLAASNELIDFVDCLPGQMEIFFTEALDPLVCTVLCVGYSQFLLVQL